MVEVDDPIAGLFAGSFLVLFGSGAFKILAGGLTLLLRAAHAIEMPIENALALLRA